MKHDNRLIKQLVDNQRSLKRGQQKLMKSKIDQDKRLDIVENNIGWHRTIWILLLGLFGINR